MFNPFLREAVHLSHLILIVMTLEIDVRFIFQNAKKNGLKQKITFCNNYTEIDWI